MSLTSDPPPLIYFPLSQNYGDRVTLIVRSTGIGDSLASAVRAQTTSLDRDLPVYAMETMQEHVADSLWRERMAVDLIGVFGLFAMALAALGLCGVVTQAAAQRTREMGIRIALGAERRDVLRLVVGEGMLLAALGIGAGIVAALPLSLMVTGLLHGVTPHDPATLVAVACMLTVVACSASYWPARRAASVDPLVALRHE
jgi:putative ABC transport system permease protein